LSQPLPIIGTVIIRKIELDGPLDLRRSCAKLVQGPYDPTATWDGSAFWRATRTIEGPATVRLSAREDSLSVQSWGPGSEWVAEQAKTLFSAHDSDSYGDAVVDEIARRHRGLRFPRTQAVFEAVVIAVLAQRVTSSEAVNSYRRLVNLHRSPAPVPDAGPELLLPPSPQEIANTTSWQFHKLGIERKRGQALVTSARCARRLEECTAMNSQDAHARMTAIPGIGTWTWAEASQLSLGDVDSVSVGDFHLANHVGWALAGRPRSTDEDMIEYLAPFYGRRGLVSRLVSIGHGRPPAYGPRYAPLNLTSM
jgi:3-methyladenine DNA glycosylase/8-oxoguanine DNA glycosylase